MNETEVVTKLGNKMFTRNRQKHNLTKKGFNTKPETGEECFDHRPNNDDEFGFRSPAI